MRPDFRGFSALAPLTRTIFNFGARDAAAHVQIALGFTGEVLRTDGVRRRWTYREHTLFFLGDEGAVLEAFLWNDSARRWEGRVSGGGEVYLAPVLELGSALAASDMPPVLVNSLPKSGTYFVEAVFTRLGSQATRLHLMGENRVDNYQGLPDELVHTDPEQCKRECDFTLLGKVLQNGDLVAGHLDSPHAAQAVCSNGVLEIPLVRNLRDVLVSYYRFKFSKKIKPISLGDVLWREVREEERFAAFLTFYIDRDIPFFRHFAWKAVERFGHGFLRFEDLIEADAKIRRSPVWERFPAGFADRFYDALPSGTNVPGPTFSGGRSDWRLVWDERIERIFEASGLKEVNHALGYED